MTFLTPAFLLGALAAAVPIVLHLLRRERLPRVPFSDVRLLRGARFEQTRRQRLRELLLLALRVAALLLLALAFARPFVPDPGGTGEGATVVLVDTSFSVSAPGQAAEARALAHAAVDAVPDGQLVGVVAFDDAARVVAPLALARAGAHAAVDGLSPRPRATRYRDGLAAASALIGERPGRVVVVTDLQAGGWEAGGGRLSPQVEVETRRVAAPAGNLAVVGVEREPSATAVRLSRWGDGGESTRLTLEVDGEVVDESVHRVGSGESTIRRSVVLPASGVVTAAVSDPAGYPADDRRYRRLEPEASAAVLLVTADGERPELFLERALAPGDGVGGFTLATVSAADLGRRPDLLAEAAVAVLVGARGLDRAGRGRLAAFVRGGGGLLAVDGPAAAAAARAGLLGGGIDPGPAESARTPSPWPWCPRIAAIRWFAPSGGWPAGSAGPGSCGRRGSTPRPAGRSSRSPTAPPRWWSMPPAPGASSSSPRTFATRATTCPGGPSSCRSCTKWSATWRPDRRGRGSSSSARPRRAPRASRGRCGCRARPAPSC